MNAVMLSFAEPLECLGLAAGGHARPGCTGSRGDTASDGQLGRQPPCAVSREGGSAGLGPRN